MHNIIYLTRPRSLRDIMGSETLSTGPRIKILGKGNLVSEFSESATSQTSLVFKIYVFLFNDNVIVITSNR